MIITTSAGPIELITPDKIPDFIARDLAYQMVAEYNMVTSVGAPTVPNIAAASTSTYTRKVRLVKPVDDESYFMYTEMVDQLIEDITYTDEPNFYHILEDAVCDSVNNFGQPTHGILCSSTIFILCEFDENAIRYKELSPSPAQQGALLIYAPSKFKMIQMKHPVNTFRPDLKYGKYVYNKLLPQTLSRLGLE